jgi:excisionase family DNA binding protein
VTLERADLLALRDLLAELGALDTRPFYTQPALAKLFGVTERTVRSLTANGALPSYKIEGSRRYKPSDVDAYLESCREEKTA